MNAHLGGRRLTDREVADALGVGNGIRYAATTGTVAIRWEGARAPIVWTVAAAGHRPRRRLPRACPALSPHLRADDRAELRALGRHLAACGRCGVHRARGDRSWRSSRRSATSGCWPTTSRRCAPPRRTTPPRACCRAAMPTSCSTEPSASCSSRTRSSAGSSGPRASGRARSSSTARSAEPGGAPTRSCGSAPGRSSHRHSARRGRGRGAQPPAPRPRAGDRGRLGDVTDTNICSIVTSWPSSTARSRAAPRSTASRGCRSPGR